MSKLDVPSTDIILQVTLEKMRFGIGQRVSREQMQCSVTTDPFMGDYITKAFIELLAMETYEERRIEEIDESLNWWESVKKFLGFGRRVVVKNYILFANTDEVRMWEEMNRDDLCRSR